MKNNKKESWIDIIKAWHTPCKLIIKKVEILKPKINYCKYYKTKRCNEFLNNLDASCDGKYFYDGEGHALPISECPIKKENGDVK